MREVVKSWWIDLVKHLHRQTTLKATRVNFPSEFSCRDGFVGKILNNTFGGV